MMETQTIIMMIGSALVLAASYGIVWITDETKKLRKKHEEEKEEINNQNQ